MESFGKVLGIIAAIFTIIGVILAIVIYFTGNPYFVSSSNPSSMTVSSSPTFTPTPVSSSPSSTPISTSSLVISTNSAVFVQLPWIISMFLILILLFTAISGSRWGATYGCFPMLLIAGISISAPLILTAFAQYWLSTMVIIPVPIFVISNFIVCAIAVLIAYLLRMWVRSWKSL